ncbi:hypothetical protein NQ315_010590 [Exocentrus adspersus]|uniref:Mitochondrial import inner membrane translocase subunit Tim16 n=1 Tax=Exocentrus adspersus TaxID=1586481 RepID=A0AAV8W6B5_9CUCU|nr:hypothetical protein NQ315_010590 [Exocentrus adspersus]
MVKTLPKVIYYATKIFVKSVCKSILEEIESSREAARIRYNKENQFENVANNNLKQMSLSEAMRILNVEKLNEEEATKQYKRLFQANKMAQNGSFYLLSKIVRAKERIDAELRKLHHPLCDDLSILIFVKYWFWLIPSSSILHSLFRSVNLGRRIQSEKNKERLLPSLKNGRKDFNDPVLVQK